jgi:hypothetical protein
VRIDVSAPAVVGRQMKDDLHFIGCLIAKGRIKQVAFEGLAFDVVKMSFLSTGEVFGYSNLCSKLN